MSAARPRPAAPTLGIIIPEGFSDAVLSGQAASVQLVEGNDAALETGVLISVVQGVVDQFAAGTVTAAAGGISGLPHQDLAALARQAAAGPPLLTLTEGQAAAEQLSLRGTLVAGQAGLFLMFTVGFGVLGLLAEREQGTLARLRSMPVTGGTVITAKACTGFILGVVATTVLLTAGSRLFGVSFGSPLVVAVLILSVVTAATSLTFVVARLVRTAEQANVAQSILAMVLGIAGRRLLPGPGHRLRRNAAGPQPDRRLHPGPRDLRRRRKPRRRDGAGRGHAGLRRGRRWSFRASCRTGGRRYERHDRDRHGGTAALPARQVEHLLRLHLSPHADPAARFAVRCRQRPGPGGHLRARLRARPGPDRGA